MDGEASYAQKNDLEYCLLKSRNLYKHKDAQEKSGLRNGKWLKIVKNSPKVTSVTSSPSHFLTKVGENYEEDEPQTRQPEKMHQRVISLPSKTLSSPSIDYSQGTIQSTMEANGTPRFVFKLEDQKEIYLADLSKNVKGYSYTIYMQRGESSPSSHIVGKMKVSSSVLNGRIIEREFVLISNNDELPFRKNHKVMFKKVNMFKKQEPTNLETLAVVVKQEEIPKEEDRGWGLKFLKKSLPFQTIDESTSTSSTSISMDVVIPSAIHGGPADGPLSLIQRWKSQGKCDCEGWDLGCPLTILKGRPREDNFELTIEGRRHQERRRLRILNVGRENTLFSSIDTYLFCNHFQ